jgi:hypothetical protein
MDVLLASILHELPHCTQNRPATTLPDRILVQDNLLEDLVLYQIEKTHATLFF